MIKSCFPFYTQWPIMPQRFNETVDLGSRKKGTYILQGNAKAHTSLQPKLLDTFVDGILECIRYVRPLDYTWVHRWKSTISRPNSVRYNNHSDWYSINTRENFPKIDVCVSSKIITYLNTYSRKGGLPGRPSSGQKLSLAKKVSNILTNE